MSEALCAAWRPAPSGEGAAGAASLHPFLSRPSPPPPPPFLTPSFLSDLALVELEGSMASEGSNGKVNGSTRRVRRPPASCKRLEGIERFPNLLFTMLGFFQPLDSQSMEANQGAFCSIPCDIIYKGGEQQFQDLELKKARTPKHQKEISRNIQKDLRNLRKSLNWSPTRPTLQTVLTFLANKGCINLISGRFLSDWLARRANRTRAITRTGVKQILPGRVSDAGDSISRFLAPTKVFNI
ncbi:uncharacterized protein [Setaria viridis]|uniref:uncharacterized protein n=1 Tax=Setaria viridis TaxID=4556 RepID=UPI003B3AA1D1